MKTRLLLLALYGSGALFLSAAETPIKQFVPGALWPDTAGRHIDAHGGGFLFHQGTYYWFGEHRDHAFPDKAVPAGVRCYSSTDLYTWKDEGVALPASSDPASEIVFGAKFERPKVIFNARTGKFVMWFHFEPKGAGYTGSRSGVAVADRATGPYTYLGSVRPNAGIWPLHTPDEWKTPLSADEQLYLKTFAAMGGPHPTFPKDIVYRRDFANGQMARDMNLFVDDDGTAYHIYSSEGNGTLQISQLTDDYLRPAGRYVRVLPGGFNEGPAMFKHDGKYYIVSSGCSGWDANAARMAVATSIWGPWTALGNPCVGPDAIHTFGAQSTYVLPVAGKPRAFIYVADLWRQNNLSDSRHLWLPIQFKDGLPVIEWMEKWDLSFFDRAPATVSGEGRFVGLHRTSYNLWAKRDDDAWWIARAKSFAAALPGATPVVWHDVSVYISNWTTEFGFAKPAGYTAVSKGIGFNQRVFDHERAFAAYDAAGVKVIIGLQTGHADPVECLRVAHSVFGQHPCVAGYALDGEYFNVETSGDLRGRPLTDATAKALMETVLGFGAGQTLVLRHWDPARLPPTYRHPQLCLIAGDAAPAGRDAWITGQRAVARAAAGAIYGTELGHAADKAWWSLYERPSVVLASVLAREIPESRFMFWLDSAGDPAAGR